jgi:tetratricopeptide (TPR) repeat protein
MDGVATRDDRLVAIGVAAAEVFRAGEYHEVRAEDVATAVRLAPSEGDHRSAAGRRSAVWLYNEVRSRRVLVGLAAYAAWEEYRRRNPVPQAKPPETVGQAREAVVGALADVVRFHRAERFLLTQVGLGLGDIATSEKHARPGREAPCWPDTPAGRVAAAAWRSSCAVFAGTLAPVLAAALGWAACPAPGEIVAQARLLSDLAFRACLADPDAPVDPVAHGLAAYWFERGMVPVAGQWVADLDAAERALAATERRGTDRRAEAAARAVLIRVLLEAGTLHRRGSEEGVALVAGLERLVREPPVREPPGGAGPPAGQDDRVAQNDRVALCDAASRLGLSLRCWGDLEAAERAYRRSHSLAVDELHGDESRAARADTGLAEVLVECGRPAEALQVAERACRVRTRLLHRHPDDPASWRRLTLSEHAMVLATMRTGQVTAAVTLARHLVEDRRRRLGGPDGVNVATARIALGLALLAAGQPAEADEQFRRAQRARAAVMHRSGYRVQYDLTCRAEAAVALGEPAAAVAMLAEAPVLSDWFADRVSFRLGYTARCLHARAVGLSGDPDRGLTLLGAAQRRLTAEHDLGAADPLPLGYRRAAARVLMAAGQPERAAEQIIAAERAERTGPVEVPARLETVLLDGRVHDALGDHAGARRRYRAAVRLAAEVEDRHPLLLEARYDEAVREVDAGHVHAAVGLLAPLLDRTPLAHGLAPLGEGHPVLTAARRLAGRIGVPVPAGSAEPPWSDG